MSTIDERLVNELRRISILLALNLTKDNTQTDQIQILARIGFKPKEVAEILGTTANTVSVTLSKTSKKRSREESRAEEDRPREVTS